MGRYGVVRITQAHGAWYTRLIDLLNRISHIWGPLLGLLAAAHQPVKEAHGAVMAARSTRRRDDDAVGCVWRYQPRGHCFFQLCDSVMSTSYACVADKAQGQADGTARWHWLQSREDAVVSIE